MKLGNRTYPINAGNDEVVQRPGSPPENARYTQTLGNEYERAGIKPRMYLLNKPECLSGFIRTFNPNRPGNIEKVGFCLMSEYQAARNTIGGEN